MKLTEELIERISHDPAYEIFREDLEGEWRKPGDPNDFYYPEKNCVVLENNRGCFMELDLIDYLNCSLNEKMKDCKVEYGAVMKAFIKTLERIYRLGWDPEVDYMEIFERNLFPIR